MRAESVPKLEAANARMKATFDEERVEAEAFILRLTEDRDAWQARAHDLVARIELMEPNVAQVRSTSLTVGKGDVFFWGGEGSIRCEQGGRRELSNSFSTTRAHTHTHTHTFAFPPFFLGSHPDLAPTQTGLLGARAGAVGRGPRGGGRGPQALYRPQQRGPVVHSRAAGPGLRWRRVGVWVPMLVG